MKAKTTVLELHSEQSEQGRRLDSLAWQPCSPQHTHEHLEEQRSPYTLGIVESVQDRAAAHLTSKRVFKNQSAFTSNLTENMQPAPFSKSYMYADRIRTSCFGEMAQPLKVRLTTKNIRMSCFYFFK